MIYDITLDVEQGLNPFLASKTPANGLEASAKSSPDTDNGLQILGRGVKELVQAVRALRHLGVEDLDLPLPKIVVVGDQSTGKSSLIEGMSEIKVPRSAGTGTRCPLEINLTEDTDPEGRWSCKVFIHNKYSYQSSLKERATKAWPLGPWTDSGI